MATFGLLMVVIVVGSLLAMAALYGVMRVLAALVVGVVRLLAALLRGAGRGVRVVGRAGAGAAAARVAPVRHRHRHAS